MAARRPTVLARPSIGFLAAARASAAALAVALVLAGCDSEQSTVLQSDLPQVPGMTGRESSGLRQQGAVVDAGTFAYKGDVPDLRKRLDETKARFSELGWTLGTERVTKSTALVQFTKGNRRATVELIRNDISPGMSTAVTTVTTQASSAPPPPPPPPPSTSPPPKS